MRARPPVRRVFVWNGREDNGSLAPDGTYYFRVGLARQGRSIDLTGYPAELKTVARRARRDHGSTTRCCRSAPAP